MNPLRPIISGSIGQIFTNFLPTGRYLLIDYGPGVKQPLLSTLAFQNGFEYCNINDNPSTRCANKKQSTI